MWNAKLSTVQLSEFSYSILSSREQKCKKKQMKCSYAKYQRIRKNEWEMLFFFYINLAMSFDRFMELLSKLVCVCVC